MEANSRKRIDYVGKMILAPMVKIGTLPTRLLALHYGADLVYTEEIIDWRILRSKRIENLRLQTIDYVDTTDETLVLRIAKQERGRLVLQIGTADSNRAVRVAKMVENDVDAIDVNMGCPKGFSLKGGMGAALLSRPDTIKEILTGLVAAVKIPITCKIRLLPDLQATLDLVKIIESTGAAALAVHGRTKEERPRDENNVEAIRKIVEHVNMPVIANGGSSNNRDSPVNTYEGIREFWKNSGAASVMIARAAEWNTSVFSPKGKDDVFKIVDKYVDYAIAYDQPFVLSKYNIQQLLGGQQESPLGRKFLAASTMQELCAVFGKETEFINKQEFLRAEDNGNNHTRREVSLQAKKRKLAEIFDGDDMGEEIAAKMGKIGDVTEMYCPFVRGHYEGNDEIPKAMLMRFLRESDGEKHEVPAYFTWQRDKMFRSVVSVKHQAFSSESWEKNKKYSQQSAAIVALHCLGVRKVDLEKGASTASGLTYKAANS